MALIRWDPWTDLAKMRSDLDEAFDRTVSRALGVLGGGWLPAADMTRKGGTLVVSVDLPGVDTDDVTVEVANNQLTIAGSRHHEHEETRGGSYVRERSFGSFSRTFTLPQTVHEDEVTAEFSDGVLRVTMPLHEATTTPRTIEITTPEKAPA
jgi:HSP20 family protein